MKHLGENHLKEPLPAAKDEPLLERTDQLNPRSGGRRDEGKDSQPTVGPVNPTGGHASEPPAPPAPTPVLSAVEDIGMPGPRASDFPSSANQMINKQRRAERDNGGETQRRDKNIPHAQEHSGEVPGGKDGPG